MPLTLPSRMVSLADGPSSLEPPLTLGTFYIQPLEEAIRHKFLPARTGQSALTNAKCDPLALPARLCGLGVIDSTHLSDSHHTSKNVSAPLVSLILDQSTTPYQLQGVTEKIKIYRLQPKETPRKEPCHRTIQQATNQYADSIGGLE